MFKKLKAFWKFLNVPHRLPLKQYPNIITYWRRFNSHVYRDMNKYTLKQVYRCLKELTREGKVRRCEPNINGGVFGVDHLDIFYYNDLIFRGIRCHYSLQLIVEMEVPIYSWSKQITEKVGIEVGKYTSPLPPEMVFENKGGFEWTRKGNHCEYVEDTLHELMQMSGVLNKDSTGDTYEDALSEYISQKIKEKNNGK